MTITSNYIYRLCVLYCVSHHDSDLVARSDGLPGYTYCIPSCYIMHDIVYFAKIYIFPSSLFLMCRRVGRHTSVVIEALLTETDMLVNYICC